MPVKKTKRKTVARKTVKKPVLRRTVKKSGKKLCRRRRRLKRPLDVLLESH